MRLVLGHGMLLFSFWVASWCQLQGKKQCNLRGQGSLYAVRGGKLAARVQALGHGGNT